jgi:FtsP/CotA-like multicopper oxidase with cupredoxin domain
MTRNYLPPVAAPSRRLFVQGVAAAANALASPWLIRRAIAAAQAPILSGTEFQLEIGPMPVNISGRATAGTAINGQIPAPILRWREGDTVTLAVTNRLAQPTSIHWHGVRVPSPMDGVPGLSFAGIPPGQTFVYRFPVHQNGTYWYHSHTGLQEQTGIYGPIVIEPKAGYSQPFDRDYVVFLSDWSDTEPDTIALPPTCPVAGPITATSSTTWSRACSGRCASYEHAPDQFLHLRSRLHPRQCCRGASSRSTG